MMWTANWALVCLLAIACFSGQGDAARTPQQRREQGSPYLVLPPGLSDSYDAAQDLGEREFTLRHIYHHGSHRYPRLHRYLDVPTDAILRVTSDYGATHEDAPTDLRARAASTHVQRLAKRKPADIDNLLQHADIHGEAATLPSSAWTVDEIAGPNITDRTTVLTFAKMAANAYVQEHNAGEWTDVKGGFNYTDDFGWQEDGLRGHIFADEKNKTIVIGLKGGNVLWKKVCDCMTSTYTCNSTCLVTSLRNKAHYYWAVRDLYHNVTERYPHSDVWLSGHSLGGVVSGLLGLTYGLPTMTFEAFPDALAASRLGLPTPPGYRIGAHQSRVSTGIYHFGHTADPIYMGTCNGATSFCTIAGYAFQGVCHTGSTCTYDTVGDLGWRVGIGTHKINGVIRDVIEKYDTVPACEEDVECSDCFNWKFYESNSSDPITSSSSSSSSTRTRTETCKTPGWWGCLDESTTTGSTSSTSSSSSSSTSTCKTPGWFGCNDPITTTSSSSTIVTTPSAAPVPTITTTSSLPTGTITLCESPGWFGCNDPTTASAAPSSTAAKTTPAPTASQPSPSSVPTTKRKKCLGRHWYGTCQQWSEGLGDAKSDL
ncbi:putative lipase atg15 [Oleoguttula mirabilis]|uniref:triacylglycerol lipase n=1 Tax=Oleoguttula mirabilis TaxID=1507867 RepID=A0AAV9JS03_9PEZI|nr:putative lipase atg15 [Oleoguttula mirabilis]